MRTLLLHFAVKRGAIAVTLRGSQRAAHLAALREERRAAIRALKLRWVILRAAAREVVNGRTLPSDRSEQLPVRPPGTRTVQRDVDIGR